ncbi:MAG: site-specific integrase [Candidatus ainarchaeum sp.]|nr:site-specific integrase [Candidatus ainarchaeum sp.]
MDREFKEFSRSFARRVARAPHWQIKELSKICRDAAKARFPWHTRKCELIEKAFTDQELAQLLEVVDDPQDRLCYMALALLGLRVGELAQLRGRDLQGDELRITASKGSFSGLLRLPPALLEMIPPRRPGELLFSRTAKQLRDHFGRYRHEAGLDQIYCYTEPGGRARHRNPRYRLSLHSLRHYAIQRVYNATRDPDLARRFARHRKLQTTLGYFKSSRKEDVEDVLAQLSGHLKACASPGRLQGTRQLYIGSVVAESGAKTRPLPC